MLPKPKNWGSFEVEPFESYLHRLPDQYRYIHQAVIKDWVYRHWREFQQWLPLHPLSWHYEIVEMTNDEVMMISHTDDWPQRLRYWGDDLLDGSQRCETWLGRHMLEKGTTSVPMIVLKSAGIWIHPRSHNKHYMVEPYQIVEGHMRLAYLQSMIRRSHPTLSCKHEVLVCSIPDDIHQSA